MSLFGRAVLLVAGELAFNAIVWIAAGISFNQADGLLGLALLAWVSHSSTLMTTPDMNRQSD